MSSSSSSSAPQPAVPTNATPHEQQEQEQPHQLLELPTESVRFAELQALVRSALHSSRRQLVSATLVDQVYGTDDAAMFGGPDVLRQVLESMLDRIHDGVTESMAQFVVEQRIEPHLMHLETALAWVAQRQAWQQHDEHVHQHETRTAAAVAKDKGGLETVQQVVLARTLQELHTQRHELETQLQHVQTQLETVQEQHDEATVQHQRLSQALTQTTNELEKSANVGSMMQS